MVLDFPSFPPAKGPLHVAKAVAEARGIGCWRPLGASGANHGGSINEGTLKMDDDWG